MWKNGALMAGDCFVEYIVTASAVPPPPPNKAIQVLMYISIMHKNRSNKICFLWVLAAISVVLGCLTCPVMGWSGSG